jgi:tetratricopeptide (TPR) repeat protein
MKLVLAVALTLAPLTVFAAGEAPSTPEPTADEKCENGLVWNPETELCEEASESTQNDTYLLDSAQRYAYAGAYGDAQTVLRAVKSQDSSRTLALWGFTHRKMGQIEVGLSYYDQALDADPNNILARSYLGEAKVNMGDYDGALVQLAEIRARGGAGSRAEALLLQAMTGGSSYDS